MNKMFFIFVIVLALFFGNGCSHTVKPAVKSEAKVKIKLKPASKSKITIKVKPGKRFMTRIEMVRILYEHIHAKNHSLGMKFCTMRFKDVKKKDICKIGLLLHLKAFKHNASHLSSNFLPDKPVSVQTFNWAFRVIFGTFLTFYSGKKYVVGIYIFHPKKLIKFEKLKIDKYYPYNLGKKLIMIAAKNRDMAGYTGLTTIEPRKSSVIIINK